ncbi:MAG TPA: DUF2281 domain-containing protein [Tepidisphaeraceae bacterium]|jgi:hypothetical protein
MEPITTVKTVDDKLFDALPELRPMYGLKVEIIVREADEEPRRRPGWAKGKLWMAADFDAPLEDFDAYR